MKILVTGGAGFIGSHIVDRLIHDGAKVVIVDDLSTGYERNINSQAKFYKMDIRDEKLEDIFKEERFDFVNHHAAQIDVRKSTRDPIFDAEVNIQGSLNIIELSKRYEVKKIIYISTGGAVYGEPEYLPTNESHPINPLSQYGVTKHTVEHYLSLYYKNYGLNYTTLRYPNVYGSRQDPRGEAGVVAIFTMQMLEGIQPTIFGDGTKTRDYVYISDIVEANMMVLNNGSNEIFNLGWGKEVTDFEIFASVRRALGVKVEPIYGDKRIGEIDRICLDSSKARQSLGWKPTVKLEDGIAMTVEYYKRHRGVYRV